MTKAPKTSRVIGRRDEQEILIKALASAESEFIAVYGRRRVGKTFLIREFFGQAIRFELTGMQGVTLRDQLVNFAGAMAKAKGLVETLQPPASWQEAFAQLERHIEATGAPAKGSKHVIFLDELPWLDTARSRFCVALEHFWNSWASGRRDLLLVVCGSAASWMVTNLIDAKGGLHNRVTRKLRLMPFTLGETRTFLRSRGGDLTDYQVIELFMALGGVPHYLKMAEPGWSAAQIIDRTCFHPQGDLRTEYDNLYASLFDKPDEHLAIVKALAKKPGGLTRTELLSAAGLPSGGTATGRLDELAESGFIQMAVPFGKREKDALIRLADEFSHFHHAWIAPVGRKSAEDGYWLKQRGTPRWRVWSGYAFEGACLKHASRIKAALGISGVMTTQAPWRHAGSESAPGAQIDLLIDRADDTISLCEMKFSDGPFTIDKAYATELRQKRDTFRRISGTRKNIFLIMVTSFGIVDNAHAKELVANLVLADELFRD
jgi:hypothetical protein